MPGVDLDEYRRESLASWETMAAGWERARERIEETAAPVREWLLRELRPQRGDTVLELAAGPGETGFAAAALVGEEGRVLSSDRSPAMVEVARRRAAELGLRNVEHRVLDAEALELPDACVDGVVCRFAYMLLADPARAFAETRRVLRSGGRLALAVWREAERNPWVSISGRMLLARGHLPPPAPGAPGMFALASEERLRALLAASGFGHVRCEDVPVLFVYRDVDEYVARSRETGGIFRRVFDELPAEERASLTAELAAAFEPFAADGRIELPGLALCAVAS